MSVQAMKGGAVEFLTKPFRDQDLFDAIQVGRARSRSRSARRWKASRGSRVLSFDPPSTHDARPAPNLGEERQRDSWLEAQIAD
jgi:DNA-binding response OmpR family regulator